MNKLLNRKSKTTKINRIIINDKAIVGDEEIVNKFNEYFSEIGKKLAEEIPDNDFDPLHYVTPVSNSFTFQTISEEDMPHYIQYENLQVC